MFIEIICAVVGIILLFFALLPVYFIIRNGIFHKKCSSKKRLDGKTALVTGSSAGIGLETARDFASRGARVLMACRNVKKAKQVVEDIKRTTGNNDIIIYQLDTSSLSSVRECAKEVLQTEERIDILVNNAGIAGFTQKKMTEDGLELIMGTNYYGHFLLTNLLLDLIVKSGPSRIVNVSSEGHSFCRSLDTNKLNFEDQYYFTALAYGQSKICQILFSNELACKLKGKGVTVNSIHPGYVDTEIFSKSENLIYNYFGLVARIGAQSSTSGAQTTIHVAVSEETQNITGQYFENRKVVKSSALSNDVELAKKLWNASVRDVRLMPNEILY